MCELQPLTAAAAVGDAGTNLLYASAVPAGNVRAIINAAVCICGGKPCRLYFKLRQGDE